MAMVEAAEIENINSNFLVFCHSLLYADNNHKRLGAVK
jgi:hypothetical protein